jgi:aryl-alcohol dehydrogenase-like predicted oxidoreductase
VERRVLGATGRTVSVVGFGTWVAGGTSWGGSEPRVVAKAIERALELGIDLFDTAPAYGPGRAEELLGETLAALGARERVFLATKCGLAWDERGRLHRDASPARVRLDVEESLRRLRTDRLDLVQVHWPDPKTPIPDTIGALEALRREGKLLHYGVSNYGVRELAEALAAGTPVVNQLPYNLFERDIERDVLPLCRERGVAVLAYGALCRGLLSGKFRADATFPRGDIRRVDPKFQPPRLARYVAAIDRLRPIAYARNKSVAQLAVRWLIDQGTFALWGARSPSQIEEVEGALGWILSPGELAGIDRILAEEIPEPLGAGFLTPP